MDRSTAFCQMKRKIMKLKKSNEKILKNNAKQQLTNKGKSNHHSSTVSEIWNEVGSTIADKLSAKRFGRHRLMKCYKNMRCVVLKCKKKHFMVKKTLSNAS